MASLRARTRKDGTEYFAVLYRLNGKQTSTSFEDFSSASKFRELANKFGPENALSTLAVDTSLASLTVGQWLASHIDQLTGVDRNTADKYRAYVRNDIAPILGDLPLAALTREHIIGWIKGMRVPDAGGKSPSTKTLANKRGFLAGALNAAVPKHIPTNPCVDVDLPPDEESHEVAFLSRGEFATLLAAVTEPWRPLVEFLVASGCRWGEAVALKPSDVNQTDGTVRIVRAWKHGSGGYRLGAPKTQKSKRTINVPSAVLEKLHYDREWLFVNRTGGPVRAHGFSRRVWMPAVERAWPSVDENCQPVADMSRVLRPRIHDLRHTCASWMIQAGVPLPVIQQHLGHESVQTTVSVYGHLDRRSMQAAADAIGQALAGD